MLSPSLRKMRVTSAGRVVPLANGNTTITVKYGDRSAAIAVKAESMDESLPINFGNHIVPIFSKLGCNSGGCHGKATGQNGFKLSLLGYEPEFDYEAIVRESRGRRIFFAATAHSLLLLKATGQVGELEKFHRQTIAFYERLAKNLPTTHEELLEQLDAEYRLL